VKENWKINIFSNYVAGEMKEIKGGAYGMNFKEGPNEITKVVNI
jgi:hypothetical protein